MRVCSQPGCPELIPQPGRCPQHARARDQARGRRQARGYDSSHDRLRRQWAPRVAAGTIPCSRCGELIARGDTWDLGHDDRDRTRYRGPEHARCNRAAGGRAAHA